VENSLQIFSLGDIPSLRISPLMEIEPQEINFFLVSISRDTLFFSSFSVGRATDSVQYYRPEGPGWNPGISTRAAMKSRFHVLV